ncbi:3-ketoacyl-CoA thiolase, mitochondrial [Centruroides vittatus]|uniref:3-ketoacyl-CoA thiolase, mitochondrial n=1 Tax=Centruroides vittatus TaxID=120091 RepID=UPI00350FBFD2
MTALVRGVFIVGAKRTPFGAFGGRLKDTSLSELAVAASKAALESSQVQLQQVNSVIFGIVNQAASPDGIYTARHTALKLGLPIQTPCLAVNRLCGSGFQAVVSAAQEICLRESEIVLAGGTENMSLSPFMMRETRFGVKFGSEPKIECSLWNSLNDSYVKMPMAITAENLAEMYKITREECDNFALQSQLRWKDAQDNGRFKDEMAPMKIKIKGKEEVFDTDEHPRPNTTMEILAKLPPVFKKGGTVTAGNASGICDGAGAIVIASEEAIKNHNLKPLARIVGYSYVGCDPKIMGIGPVNAIRQLCEQTNIKLNDVDLVDINEAFAAQFLAVEKELKLDPTKTNVNGGAIALGHPVGASGARITANLVYELRRRKGKYAIGSACIGGGQGIAIMLENVP